MPPPEIATPPTADPVAWLVVGAIWLLILIAGGAWADRVERRNPR